MILPWLTIHTLDLLLLLLFVGWLGFSCLFNTHTRYNRTIGVQHAHFLYIHTGLGKRTLGFFSRSDSVLGPRRCKTCAGNQAWLSTTSAEIGLQIRKALLILTCMSTSFFRILPSAHLSAALASPGEPVISVSYQATEVTSVTLIILKLAVCMWGKMRRYSPMRSPMLKRYRSANSCCLCFLMICSTCGNITQANMNFFWTSSVAFY